MLNLLASLLYFVTDCDGTLCHYGASYPGYNETELVRLPPSSGSGAVASVSRRTAALLTEISQVPATVICASGMRRSTALQRLPFFPDIRWWILENGGLVLEAVDGDLVEVSGWRESYGDGRARESMVEFAEVARRRGFIVDTRYETMVRVSGQGLEELLPLIPAGLGFTRNLGHLDVVLSGVGKLPAVRWLLARLHESGEAPAFLFMGDDDNDVETAAAAEHAFVTRPCSAAMQAMVESQALSSDPSRVTLAPEEGPRGTELLLEMVLRRLRVRLREDEL